MIPWTTPTNRVGRRDMKKTPKPERTLLGARLRRVHGLGQDLDGQLQRVLQGHLALLVLVLEDVLGREVVGTDRLGLPAAVIARGVGLEQLEAKVVVPAGEQEGDAEWPLTCEWQTAINGNSGEWFSQILGDTLAAGGEGGRTAVLRVALLQVANLPQELLDGDRLLELHVVTLGSPAGVLDQNVRVRGDTGGPAAVAGPERRNRTN